MPTTSHGPGGRESCGPRRDSTERSGPETQTLHECCPRSCCHAVNWDLGDCAGALLHNTDAWLWLIDYALKITLSPRFFLPVKRMVTIVMDGACPGAFTDLEDAFQSNPALPMIACQWCSAHNGNLLLKAIGNIDGTRMG